MRLRLQAAIAATLFLSSTLAANAATITFFSADQDFTKTVSGDFSDTYSSLGYLFEKSMDKGWATYNGGTPVGRYEQVLWPTGIHVQAITSDASGNLLTENAPGANLLIRRADGNPFDLDSFTAQLRSSTAGAGGAFELMPVDDQGEDALGDPIQLPASGSSGISFSYTPNLSNYYAYKIHLWGDWALMELTITDQFDLPPTSVPEPMSLSLLGLGALLALRRRR